MLLGAEGTFRDQSSIGDARAGAKIDAGEAAIARGDVQNRRGSVGEPRRESALSQFHGFHHVAIERGAAGGEILALDSMKGLVQQYAVEVETDLAEIGAAK